MSNPEQDAKGFAKSHGRTAGDIMIKCVISVDEDEIVSEMAHLLEERRIKRVPVLRDGALVCIASRGNLLQALASQRQSDLMAPVAQWPPCPRC